MKDSVWIFQSFGFATGFKYLWDSVGTKIKRLFKKEKTLKFEDLTDKEARWTALAFGIHSWKDRKDLNRQWNKFEETHQNRS